MDIARRIQECFPHVGITVRLDEDEPTYRLQMSDYQPVEDMSLNPMYGAMISDLLRQDAELDVILVPPDREGADDDRFIAYLAPLAQAA